MQQIKFDFNNMFSVNLPSAQGVSNEDIHELLPAAQMAHSHLEKVFGSNKDRIGLGLEWVKLPYQDKGFIKFVQKTGKEIAKKYDNVIFLGIGGSFLGLKAAQDALAAPYYNEFKGARKSLPRVYFEGNNLDPDTLSLLLKSLNPKKTFVVVISKSGETTETKAAFMVVEAWLKKGAGKNYGRQVFLITDPQSGALRSRIEIEQKKDNLSFRSLPLLRGVGGRFSEFNMGLLHLAIIGIDILKVLNGAADMAKRCANSDYVRNPAYMYAMLHTIFYKKKGKPLAVIMPFSETLKSTADWYVQLLAESLGKKYGRKVQLKNDGCESWERDMGKIVNLGRTPIPCRGTSDLHSVQQNNIEGQSDKVITFIKVDRFRSEIRVPGKGDMLSGREFSSLINLAQEATEWALVVESRPNCTINLPEVSAYYWGGLLFFFEMATAFEGELLNLNAFDQPGVEGYKNYMYYKLGKPGIPKSVVEAINGVQLKKSREYII